MQRNRGDEVYNYQNQDFNTLRDWHFRNGYLFEDPLFKLTSKYEWRRPWEIVQDPKLFVRGSNQFDVLQGQLGDCWMLASIAVLAMHPGLVKNVIPPDQDFQYQYAGIFHFRFWRFGKWYDVVIDDRLPTRKGKLVYTKSVSQNEFWTALLEKAYCKILGGEYKVADAGNLCEALEDFTGGVTEQYLLKKVPMNFPSVLLKSMARRSLLGCFIDNLPGSSQSKTPEGLVRGHSYSITDVKSVVLPGHGSVVLVRVRNPWGQYEWTGPWSDNSQEWQMVPQTTKQELGLVRQNDGEFWMEVSDFTTYFQWMDMCHLSPSNFIDAYGQSEQISSWYLEVISGSWVRGVTDGGVRKLHRNPQVRFTLSEADDESQDGMCSVLIALCQKVTAGVNDYCEIGFKVYQLNESNVSQTVFDQYFFQNNRSVADVLLKRVREVACRYNLLPGSYFIVPFTYKEGKEGEFLMRIYSEKGTPMDYMDSTIGLSPEDLVASENPPMKLSISSPMKISSGESKVDEVDMESIDYFNKVSGADKEVDWKELKDVLDFAVKSQIKHSDKKNESWGDYLVDSVSSVYNKVFGSTRKVNAFETVGKEGFSPEVCRSMVALLDVNRSGKLSYDEFQDLWSEIKIWKSIYESHSNKTSGYLEASGLKDALGGAGFNFSRLILSDIVHRYSTKDGILSFDDLLHCTVKIKAMAKFFKSKHVNGSGKAEITFEEFMDETLYS